MGIKWSPGWEEDLRRAAQPALKDFTRRNQPKMDALTERYKGRPIEEIRAVVQREMKRWGASVSDSEELTRIATAISRGERVRLNTNG
ncbi:hypothetical protein [Mycolicibacterium iranicum]|uniref:Uncharacterized protein n=1 Tax=Mycolicibacterium iranicum TaxID=912594 RepID=A0ABT4HM40_MYCIR|nr:hypothetical protein [Mycolicibacterium iranicum]MCZ0731164.1 hypothetical protein [Mycolicibacterium iranicum]